MFLILKSSPSETPASTPKKIEISLYPFCRTKLIPVEKVEPSGIKRREKTATIPTETTTINTAVQSLDSSTDNHARENTVKQD